MGPRGVRCVASAGASGRAGGPRQAPRGSPSDRTQARAQGAAPPLKINQDLRLYRARKLRRDGDRSGNRGKREACYGESEDMFRQVLDADARDGRAYVGLAKLFERRRRADLARATLEDGCAATGGDNAYIWQTWGSLEYKQGNIARARQLFDAAIAADSSLTSAYHSWAMLEMKEGGNARKARKLLMRALAAAEGNKKPRSHIYVALAKLANDCGEPEAARSWFRLGVASGNLRDCAPAFNAWATMEARAGNENEARELFRKGLRGAKSRFTWLSLITWETRWGNHERANELLDRASKLFPSDAAIAQFRARSFTQAAEGSPVDMPRARELFDRALAIDRGHQPTWHAWAAAEWNVGRDAERARELFQQGIWAGPTSAGVWRLFATWADLEARENGDAALARSLFACALRAQPDNAHVVRSWKQMEHNIGDALREEELSELLAELRATGNEVASTGGESLWPVDVVSEALPLVPAVNAEERIVRSLSESLDGLEMEVETVVAEFIFRWTKHFDSKKSEVAPRQAT